METKRSLPVTLLPPIGELFFAVALPIVFFAGKGRLLGDCDTGYHIRAGEYILRTRSVPRFDIFSLHTPPLPWTAHEWLSEVVMALLHGAGGLTAVDAFFATVLSACPALLYLVLKSYGTQTAAAGIFTLCALSSFQVHWLSRPHVFSFVFMLLFHYLLETWRHGKFDRLYLLPPLMLLWVNLHGGYLGGFILIAAYLAGCAASTATGAAGRREQGWRNCRRLAAIGLSCLGASLVNPAGYRILLFPFKLVGDTFIMDHVSEFLSPNFHFMTSFRIFLLLVLALLALSRKRLPATDLLLLAAFTNMSLYSARYISLFALVVPPVLSRNLRGIKLPPSPVTCFLAERSRKLAALDAGGLRGVWGAAALVAVIVAVVSGKVEHRFDPKVKAVETAEFLMRENIPGNMFNNDEIGDYLIYRTFPRYRVFFDGRSDMYGSALMKEYYRVTRFQPGWEEVLAKHRIGWVVFDTDSELTRFLALRREWALVHSDPVASVFVRRIPLYQGLIDRHPGVSLWRDPAPPRNPA
ncbi:hypothetical protein GMSM_23340 [Geomonas sp. Red276]